MISRSERDKIRVHTLDLEIFFDEMFEQCRDQHELDWVLEQIQGCAELSHDQASEKFYIDED